METLGFFDSGVGGLTVLGAVQDRVPNLNFHYFGDTAHCPYGDRPLDEVRQYALNAVNFLVNKGCDRVIMACNISSSVALETARSAHPELDVDGLINDALVERVHHHTESGSVGVLATTGTVRSGRYAEALEGEGLEVKQQACSPLVPLIESGQLEGPTVRNTLEPLLEPMRESDVDTVVLGCTHYPFLGPAIKQQLDPGTTLVDPGKVLADNLFSDVVETNGGDPVQQFYASGETRSMKRTLEEIMNWPIESVRSVTPSEVAAS
jgi:glutamate racemase